MRQADFILDARYWLGCGGCCFSEFSIPADFSTLVSAYGMAGMEYAIQTGDINRVARVLKRFPALRTVHTLQGISFRQLACNGGNTAIIKLFETDGAD